tara:strand:- start:16626 stop:17105 length:480 start_codon:yes stop_codon:yes gene_type:complete
MIDGAPKIVKLTIYLHENLVEVRSPVREFSTGNPPLSDLRCEHRPEPVPTKPHRPLGDINPALVSRSSTFRSESGKRMYIITARRMISGEVLKYLNRLRIRGGSGIAIQRSNLSSSDKTTPDHRGRTHHQWPAQIAIAHLRYPPEALLAAGRALSRHQA